jgi:hypothetical protein
MWCTIVTLCLSQSAQAQFWNKVKSHAADVVNGKIDDAVSGGKDGEASKSTPQAEGNQKAAIHIDAPFDFQAGSEVIFEDNFSGDPMGKFPHKWKTNASGSVVSVPGVSGRWFLLDNEASYKLDSLLSMPEDFTVEFDILASADQADDLSAVHFGFTRDNSMSSYLSGVGIAGVELYYYNDDEYYTASRDLNNHHFGNFNLVNTLNKPLHVSISVKGTHMKVYLERTRILDAEMFLPGSRKYFFFSSSSQYQHGAKVMIGNVRIAKG